jgi:galactose mutarotase-like enzyme
MKISQTAYKDIDAVAVENDHLRAVFLPAYGGKMASLVCRKTGREFLVQAKGDTYQKLGYAGAYIDAECSGFDDMFPTIDAWAYDKYPWCGAVMPDHGEVCGLPWHYQIEDDVLHCWVFGVRFPYRLDKWIRFKDEATLSISYKAENLTPFDFEYIWAAHVMINAEPGARILLPYDDGAPATCVFSEYDAFAEPGMAMHWPKTQTKDQGIVDISRTREHGGNTFKFYFDAPMPAGVCGYMYADGTVLRMGVSETVPYLGVWINEGAFKNYDNIALEPCTGTFDDPAAARRHGQNSILPGLGVFSWALSFSIESGRGIR